MTGRVAPCVVCGWNYRFDGAPPHVCGECRRLREGLRIESPADVPPGCAAIVVVTGLILSCAILGALGWGIAKLLGKL